jgi:hypothetical protein
MYIVTRKKLIWHNDFPFLLCKYMSIHFKNNNNKGMIGT